MPVLVIFKPGFTDPDTVQKVEKFLMEGGFRFIQVNEPELIPREFFEQLYLEHLEKPFYEDNLKYVTSGPCKVCLVTTNAPKDLEPTKALDILVRSKDKPSVRSLYGKNIRENVLHCSDSQESCAREIELAIRYGIL